MIRNVFVAIFWLQPFSRHKVSADAADGKDIEHIEDTEDIKAVESTQWIVLVLTLSDAELAQS